METLKIGIIGLDTSHVVAFTKLLNDPEETHAVPGGKVEIAYPGGSSNFHLSQSRVEGFTQELRDTYEVQMTDDLEDVARKSDAILLESVDGGQHLQQLEKIIAYQKPVFIDKPFALTLEDADEMIRLSEMYETPLMSSSALRFAENLQGIIKDSSRGNIIGADCFGPMDIQPSQPGYFWYGIHMVEMLFTILGKGVREITAQRTQDHDVLMGRWHDGRFGTIRGNRLGNHQFGAVVHFEKESVYVDISKQKKPYYASLLEEVMAFFHHRISRVPISETRAIIQFIEKANESRLKGKKILV